MYKTRIEVKTQFEGLHCWPEAPDNVKFLQHMHRHMFHVVLRIPVNHNNRDLEFVMVKRDLEKFIKDRYGWPDAPMAIGRMSCEDVAASVIRWVHMKYDRRGIEVGVFEDGENGCWMEDVDAGGY